MSRIQQIIAAVCMSHLSQASYIPHPSHPPLFDQPNRILWSIQVMKLQITLHLDLTINSH